MDSHRPTVSISKSSPSIINFQSGKRRTRLHLRQPILIGQRQFQDFKRSIVANHEKGAVAQRKPYYIVEQGKNFTPQALYDPGYPSASDKQYSGLPAAKPLGATRSGKIHESPSTSSMHSLMSRYSVSRRSRTSVAMSIYSAGFTSIADLSWHTIAPPMLEEEMEVEIRSVDRAPSMFRLRADPPPRKRKITTHFMINLEETETMFMLVIPTNADSSASEEGKVINEQNIAYENNVQTIKTKSHTATQTTRVFQKHRKLYMPRNERTNSSAWATVWDIHDTFEERRRVSLVSTVSREEGLVDHIKIVREDDNYAEDSEYPEQKSDNKLLNALMVVERLIQKEHFSEKQLLFQGLLVQDPLSINVSYEYSLTLLWTFRSMHTKNRKVTSICWSPKNQNVLAVGYGKFKYTDKCKGLVCIWNVKNPFTPERQFPFDDPVTFVAFSGFRYQILAVTFYSGLVILVDIITRSLIVRANNNQYPLYYPVWQARWFPNEDKTQGQYLLTSGKNGRVYRYKKTKFFVSKKLMSVGRPHGNIQGVSQPKKCYARKTLSSRHPSAEVLVPHPSDPLLYMVGTSEGCVYLCSVNHRHDHIDVFVAHNGPVYRIQFNPFCSKVFLTCGADWCIRIWAETIFEPLITLESGMAVVQDALWNPLHSTIIVSITGTFIEIWDIRRRTSTPKSSTESPTKSLNTLLEFSENKYNVCIGDVDGNVHIMALTDMPFSPSFQEEILAQSILNMLITRPEIQEKLFKLGQPFASEESSYKTKMYRKLDHLHKASGV